MWSSTTSFWFRPLSQTLNRNIQLPIKQLLVERLSSSSSRTINSYQNHKKPQDTRSSWKKQYKSVIPSVSWQVVYWQYLAGHSRQKSGIIQDVSSFYVPYNYDWTHNEYYLSSKPPSNSPLTHQVLGCGTTGI